MTPGTPTSRSDTVNPARLRRRPAAEAQDPPIVLLAIVAALLIGTGVVIWRHNENDYPTHPVQNVPTSVRAYRAFEPTSWWNTPLPANPPLDPAGTPDPGLSEVREVERAGLSDPCGCGQQPVGHAELLGRPGRPHVRHPGDRERPPTGARLAQDPAERRARQQQRWNDDRLRPVRRDTSRHSPTPSTTRATTRGPRLAAR